MPKVQGMAGQSAASWGDINAEVAQLRGLRWQVSGHDGGRSFDETPRRIFRGISSSQCLPIICKPRSWAATLVSGWGFAMDQFTSYWPYIVALTSDFGIQVGLFARRRNMSMSHHHAKHVVAASGATSTAAMLACCTHYLANVLPILGAVGLVTFIAQYQIELFAVGLAFNVAGLAYIGRQVWLASRGYRESPAC